MDPQKAKDAKEILIQYVGLLYYLCISLSAALCTRNWVLLDS